MRDLAKSHSYIPRNKSKFSSSVLRIFIIILVVVGAIYFIGDKITGGSIIGGGSSVHDAPAGLTPVQVSGAPVSVAGGVNLSSDAATLKYISDKGNGSATATRVYGNGGYSLSVSATLPSPGANSYAVFLAGSDGQPVFTDFMSGSGTSWSLAFNDKDKYSKLNKIWITRKITKESQAPETYIMEGSF